MVKHTQTIRPLLPMNCLSRFHHFIGLLFKGLTKKTPYQWRRTFFKFLFIKFEPIFYVYRWTVIIFFEDMQLESSIYVVAWIPEERFIFRLFLPKLFLVGVSKVWSKRRELIKANVYLVKVNNRNTRKRFTLNM